MSVGNTIPTNATDRVIDISGYIGKAERVALCDQRLSTNLPEGGDLSCQVTKAIWHRTTVYQQR